MSRHCHLLGGMFALVVQLFLATICIIAAIVKRSNEKPRREWNIWTLDISKQFIGSSFGHFSNIGLSIVISDKISGYADECQWYCLAYVFDSVLGTFLNISILYGFERIIRKYFPRCLSLSSAGDYGIPPSLKTWFVQLFVWIIIITISKFGILLILLNAANPLNNFIAMIFSWFKIHPDLELIMVMVIMPGTFNTLQFWIQDTYIKKQSGPLTNHEIDIILTREDQLMSKKFDNNVGTNLLSTHSELSSGGTKRNTSTSIIGYISKVPYISSSGSSWFSRSSNVSYSPLNKNLTKNSIENDDIDL